MEKSFVFDAVLVDGVYDREYLSEDFCNYFKSFISDGVFPNPSTNLQVIASSNMDIVLNKGKAFKNGRLYENTEPLTFTIEPADGVLNRIDTVILQVDNLKREFKAVIKKGTFAVNPIPQELLNNADYEELKVAEVYVKAGTIKITQADITDTRLDKNVCGLVSQMVQSVDTSTLYRQIQSDLEKFNTEEKARFLQWFDGIKIILDENTAGNLLNLINSKADKTTVYTKQETDTHRTYTLTHTKLGTVHTLSDLPTGQGIYQCQFIAQADYTEGDTFTGYTAKPTGEETILPDKAFVKGDIVSVLVDTVNKKLGFKIGGSGVNQTLPPQIRSFAVTSGNAQNKLSWLLPVDTSAYEGLLIVKKVGSAPTKVSDGTKISLSKTATSYTDTGLTNDTKYYYRAFPYNAKKQYQTELIGAVAWGTPKAIDPVFANNSWEVIDSVSRSGNIPSTWKVGDTKDITLTSGETLTMQIYGFNHDDLSNGSGKAGITMGMKNLMANTRQMNLSPSNIGGFTGTNMYEWLQKDLYNSLPVDLKIYFKAVNKKTSYGNYDSQIKTNSMKLFLFSEIEVWGGTNYSFSGEGSPYSIVSVVGKEGRIKKLDNGNGVAKNWWLRSPHNNSREYFCFMGVTGSPSYAVTDHYGVCFGFCI